MSKLAGKGDLQPQLDSALQDVNDMYLLLEETEKQAVRKALIEERGRFCTFIAYLQPTGELAMLGEITHLQGILDDLAALSAEPHKLPSASEQDWSKAGACEPPGAATLQRRKDRVEHLREAELGSATLAYPGLGLEEGLRPRVSPATIAAKHGEAVSPAASDLALALTRGLSLEQQKSSRDSLQYSSGYSTQTTTPSCSEDTIPSQGSDYDGYSVNGEADGEPQSDFDKSSTIPRNSNVAQNYRRMIQTKRPASTAGLPTGTSLPAGATPGVATIRRTPSTKPAVRRTLSSAGPIPIRPPIVPVKTPTVPDSPGYAGPTRRAACRSD
ncbi:Protein MTSS 2 [Varanus komodoensis]|nr:Protein MTSS 2 [Varanus komodoensis]